MKKLGVFEGLIYYAAAVFIGVFAYIMVELAFCPVIVEGESMEPTYHSGDILKSIRADDRSVIEYGDIVVCRDGLTRIVKRVVALPGDMVTVKDGLLCVASGDSPLLISEYNYDDIADSGCLKDTIILGDNEYFVLGDNRNHSIDSRFMGPIKRADIKNIVKDKLF